MWLLNRSSWSIIGAVGRCRGQKALRLSECGDDNRDMPRSLVSPRYQSLLLGKVVRKSRTCTCNRLWVGYDRFVRRRIFFQDGANDIGRDDNGYMSGSVFGEARFGGESMSKWWVFDWR